LNNRNVIKPGSSLEVVKTGGVDAWHEYIAEGKSERLYFYVFETDTLRKYLGLYSMYDFVKNCKYFKNMSYSESELDKMGWKIQIDK
jgi:hypothetical protein